MPRRNDGSGGFQVTALPAAVGAVGARSGALRDEHA
jgi:hypothetical protein